MRRIVCFIWKVEANGNDTDVFEVGLPVATDHGAAPAKEEEDMYILAGAAHVMTSFVPLQCTSRE